MDIYLAILRYIHVGAGIIWIGLLYYFNFVQVPSFARMEAPARSNAVMVLVPTALAWFRYAALVTWLGGGVWMLSRGFDVGWSGYISSPAFKSVLVGAILGTIMFLNVWLIIWPNQRRIIAATAATVRSQTPAPPQQPRWTRTAFLASRLNTALSIPMLFFMIASAHLVSVWT
jgi:uncharacterized membrane protein